MASQRSSGILGRKDAAGDARAFLGVFGKHPGWNDHIDDIGLTTERLVQVKRVLYVEGIGGNIDAGAWDAIPETGRLAEFEHAFVWRSGSETAMGRFWSSRDGKGRTRYPMVVCGQVRGQPVSWQVRYLAPLLERLEEEFKATEAAERVIALAENAQRELEALAAGEAAPADKHERSATATLADDPAMGPERRGMYRLLYQMERELSAYLRGGMSDGSRSRTADLTPRHLRVPRCLSDEAQSVLLWWRFLTEHLGDGAPLVLLSPRGRPFLDILVGEPGVSQFTCAKAGEETIPLTTEIPYSFDAEFVRRAEERIAATPAEVKPDTGTKKIQQVGAGIGGALEKIKIGGNGGGLEPKQIAMIAGAAVLGLVVIGGAIMLLTGGGGGTPETPGPGTGGSSGQSGNSNPETGAPGGAVGANFGAAQRADFAEWCAQAEWALQLRDRLAGADLSVLQGDPHLAERVTPLLEALRSPDLIIDPRRVASGGARQLAALGSAPPPSAQSDEGIARTTEALRVIRGLRAAVEPAAWPSRGTVERVAGVARLAGWVHIAEALQGVSQRVSLASPAALQTLVDVARASVPAARLEAAWSGYQSALSAVEERQGETHDERLERLPDLLLRVEAPASAAASSDAAIDAVAAAAGRLEAIAALTMDVARAVQDRWGSLDLPYFLASSSVDAPPGNPDEAYFRAWIQEARRDAYTLLDPGSDPRSSWDVEARMQTLARDIDALRQAGGGIDPAEIAGMERELGALRERFGHAAGLEWDRTGQAGVLAAADQIERGVAVLEGSYDRLTGRLTEQWERETARLRERVGVRGVSSTALLRAWRERRDALLQRFTTPDRLTALSEQVEALEAFLVAVEQAVPAPPMPRERPSVLDADALEHALADEREQAVGELLAEFAWDGQSYEADGFETEAAATRQRMEAWSQRVANAALAMAQVEDLLVAGYGSTEPGPGGATMVQLAGQASADAVGAKVAAVFEPLGRQVAAITRAEAQRDSTALARAAGDATAPIGVALASWRALDGTGWPESPAQLRTEGELARSLAARIAGFSDDARRDAVEAEIAAAQRRRWLACAGRIQAGQDAAALREVLSTREAFGVPLDATSGMLRFNALTAAFAASTLEAAVGSDEAALKRTAVEFVASVDALGVGEALPAAAGAWLEDVRALTADAPAAPVLDPTTIGPGSVGWSGEEVADGSRVRFTSPDGAHTLEFARVDPGDDPGVTEGAYLCTTELSIGVLQWIAGQSGNLERLRTLTEFSPPSTGAGIKTWVFDDRQGVAPAEGWFLTGEVAAGIQPWAQGLSPGKPSLGTPVSQLPPAAAVGVAELLGCRLPTGSEWQAARARYETGNGVAPVWNLRDNTWGAQLRHVRSVQSGGRLGIRFPDEGVFHPVGSGARTEGQAQTIGSDDGSLFFDDVGRERGRTMFHLIGNVAEFVTMGGASSPQFGVVGSSALSAPEDYQALQAACVIPVETLDFGWSDVGVRLAFSAKAEGAVAPLWRRMQRLGVGAPVVVGVAPGAPR